MIVSQKKRCPWPGEDPLMLRYHDEEWGVPVHDDRKWFEFIVLDAFQAGLSWKTVLHRRKAFYGNFDDCIWAFAEGRVIQNRWRSTDEVPPKTELSDRVSKDLEHLRFSFVGSVICYSFLQAGGVVNDHLADCFRHGDLIDKGAP